MRYLRKQVFNRRAPGDQRVYVDANDAVVMTTTNNITLPSGTTAQRPASPSNGMMRYNTDIAIGGELEVYQSGNWRSLRFKESTQITQQSLGAGDGNNLYFGPLSPTPPTTVQSNASWGGQNLLVIVENIIQLSTTNYTVVQNPTIPTETYTPKLSVTASIGATTLYFNSHVLGTGASASGGTVTLTFTTLTQSPFAVGSSITVSNFIPNSYNGTYTVTASTNSSVSFTGAGTSTMTVAGQIKSADAVYTAVDLIGADVSVAGYGTSVIGGTTIVSFVSDPNTDALISAEISNPVATIAIPSTTVVTVTEATQVKSGYYLKFSSPVPIGKMITVLHGFDK